MLSLLIAKGDQAVTLNTGFDQLTKTGDTEAFCNIVGVFTIAFGFIRISDTTALGSCNTKYQVKVMRLGQFRPAVDDIAIILRWSGQTCAVIYAIVVEEDTKTLVSLLQGSLCEVVSSVRCFVGVGTFTN